MKIWVDSTLTNKCDWFELIPINISLDEKEILDKNELSNREAIVLSKNKKTSFYSPSKVEELLDKKEKNIIFTIPSSLSGQFGAYQSLADENTIILEGQCLTTNIETVKNIISENENLIDIKNKIDNINKKVRYDGLIFDLSSIPKKGRIASVFINTLDLLNMKMWLKFQDGKWNKHRVIRNVKKTIAKIIEDKQDIKIVAANKLIFDKFKEIAEQYVDKKNIHFLQMTNAMIIHVGEGFIAIA